MRKWHRWIATVAGLFVAFVSITGALMHIDMFISGVAPPGSEPVLPFSGAAAGALDPEALAAMTARAVSHAKTQRPDLKVSRIEIALKDGKTIVTLGGNLPADPSLRLDGASGNPAPPLPPKVKNYHYALQDLHAGYFLGLPGRILSALLGLSLLVLSITGIKLYIDLLRRRRQAGRKGLFWDS
jgi:uncharacterized iron-regulated membrane protein